MNQRTKLIMIVVLLLAAGGLFYLRTRPSAEDRKYQENFAKTQAEQKAAAQAGGGATGAPTPGQTAAPATATAPKAGAPATVPVGQQGAGAVQSQFKRTEVNPQELLAKITEVSYDYAFEQRLFPRDPMTPLVGPMALPTVSQSAAEGGEAAAPTARETQALIQSMRLTGIVWDSKNPVAIINNEIVSPGDEIARGIVVESVEPDHVLMRTSTGNLIPIELEER